MTGRCIMSWIFGTVYDDPVVSRQEGVSQQLWRLRSLAPLHRVPALFPLLLSHRTTVCFAPFTILPSSSYFPLLILHSVGLDRDTFLEAILRCSGHFHSLATRSPYIPCTARDRGPTILLIPSHHRQPLSTHPSDLDNLPGALFSSPKRHEWSLDLTPQSSATGSVR